MRHSFIFALFVITLLLSACETHRSNSKDDRQFAEEQADDFYNKLLAGHYDSCALKFAGTTTEDMALRQMLESDSLYGKPSAFLIEDISTEVTEVGDETHGTFLIKVRVEYNSRDTTFTEHKYTKETLRVIWNDTELYIDERTVVPE